MSHLCFRYSMILALVVALMIQCGCDGGSSDTADSNTFKVRINGIEQEGTVAVRNTADGAVVDAQAFAGMLPGMAYYPMENPKMSGMTLQYGQRISFTAANFTTGFIDGGKFTMNPPVELSGTVYWTPTAFFAQAVDGKIQVDNSQKVIDVTLSAPTEIGYQIHETSVVAQELARDFDLRRGEICLTDPIDLYAAGYVEDCNGNNSGATYLITYIPASPRIDALNVPPPILQMDQDEAFVWVGRTPPETKYFSYQPYLMNRYLDDVNPPTIKKIYARLSDAINAYNLPLSAVDPFDQFFVLIIAANQNTYDNVRQAVLNAGIASDQIMSLSIPHQTEPNLPVNFGLGLTADSFNFLHRATVFARNDEKTGFTKSPPIEVLRVTPKIALAPNPMPRPASRERYTGIKEQNIAGLGPLLTNLRAAIIARYAGDYRYVTELKTSTWMYPGGDVAIDERVDVLGETNDTLYLQTEKFVLQEDDLIVVFGINHDMTAKTVYANVSCYGAAAENGVGGIVSTPKGGDDAPPRASYFGTAGEYLPDLPLEQSNMAYVYKFARQADDDTTYAIPYNLDGSFHGHNNGDTVFMGFRNYVDILTTVGAYPGDVRDGTYFFESGPADSEIFFDQAIIFSDSVTRRDNFD